jgi:parallel beta-helix repeat protein
MRLKVAIIAALMVSLPAVCFAGDEEITRLHDHTYNSDQTWSGKIIIDGVVQFSPEAKLTIMPGTVIMFTKNDTDGDGIGENEVYIQGGLKAVGTKDNPIVFTSAEKVKRPGDWGAVNIMVSDKKPNELEDCVIEYGYRGFHMHFSKATVKDCTMRNSFLGIQCQDSDLDVVGCTIAGNRGAIVFKDSRLLISGCNISDNYWGIRFLYGEVVLKDNRITGNMINGVTFRENKVTATGNLLRGNRKGFSAEKSEVLLKDNIITGSDESGIYLKHATGLVTKNEISGNGNSGVSIEDSGTVIQNNNITGNAVYAIDNNGGMAVDARANWWGTTEKSKIARMVFDNEDDPKIGRVDTDNQAARPFGIEAIGVK